MKIRTAHILPHQNSATRIVSIVVADGIAILLGYRSVAQLQNARRMTRRYTRAVLFFLIGLFYLANVVFNFNIQMQEVEWFKFKLVMIVQSHMSSLLISVFGIVFYVVHLRSLKQCRSLLRQLCWQMAAGAAGTSRALGETGRAQEARGTRAEPFVGSCTSAQRTAMAVDRARDEWTRRWRRRDGRERDSRVERELEQANIGSSSPRRII